MCDQKFDVPREALLLNYNRNRREDEKNNRDQVLYSWVCLLFVWKSRERDVTTLLLLSILSIRFVFFVLRQNLLPFYPLSLFLFSLTVFLLDCNCPNCLHHVCLPCFPLSLSSLLFLYLFLTQTVKSWESFCNPVPLLEFLFKERKREREELKASKNEDKRRWSNKKKEK